MMKSTQNITKQNITNRLSILMLGAVFLLSTSCGGDHGLQVEGSEPITLNNDLDHTVGTKKESRGFTFTSVGEGLSSFAQNVVNFVQGFLNKKPHELDQGVITYYEGPSTSSQRNRRHSDIAYTPHKIPGSTEEIDSFSFEEDLDAEEELNQDSLRNSFSLEEDLDAQEKLDQGSSRNSFSLEEDLDAQEELGQAEETGSTRSITDSGTSTSLITQ